MFSFKYRPDIMANEYRITCNDSFTRIASTKSYYEYTCKTSKQNAKQHDVCKQSYTLWSYATPIIIVDVHTDYDDSRMYITLFVNESSWNVSNTTIGHLSRFMRWLEMHYGIVTGISYYDIKSVMKSTRMHFFYDAHTWCETHLDCYERDVSIVWHRKTYDEMMTMLKARHNIMPLVERV